MNSITDTAVSRRTVLRATAATAATTAGVGAVSDTAVAQDTTLEEWFSNTENYDGVVDRTGESEVTVEVGTDGNGAQFGFGPAAIRIDPGTTVTWKWVAGTHNVVASDGSYESKLTGESGFTFTQTFDSAGVSKYYCNPHKTMGMKGAVVVGDAEVGTSATGGGSGGGGGGLSLVELGVAGAGGLLGVGLIAPLAKRALTSSDRDSRP